MNKTLLIKILSILIFLLVIFSFYQINQKNYEKHREILFNYVDHPEGLPTPEFAKKTSFWFANLRADLYWLQTIQYIWWNAVSSEYKKYLFAIIHLVTELNPYFEKPYIIAQLLLPDYNPQYEDLSEKDQSKHVDEAIEISLKWMNNFCDMEKIDRIKQENNLNAIITKDVEPYTVVGGNPAKLIKKRFSEDKIRELLDSRWWEWDTETIKKNKDFFFKNHQ